MSAFLCFFVCFLCNSYSQRWSTLRLFFLSRRFRLILTVTSSPLSRLPMSCCVWCWVVIPSYYYPLLFFFFPTSHWLPLLEQCPSFLPLATLVLVLVPTYIAHAQSIFLDTFLLLPNKQTHPFLFIQWHVRTYPFAWTLGWGGGKEKTRQEGIIVIVHDHDLAPSDTEHEVPSLTCLCSVRLPLSLSLSLQWVRAQGLQGICTICNMDVRLKYTHHTWP